MPDAPKDSVVYKNGALGVAGTQLVNRYTKPIQLKGVSTHGLQWKGQFANYDAMKNLRDQWGMTIFRAAMYTVQGGYLENQAVKQTVINTVDSAIKLGVYVVIDWHILYDSNPMDHLQEAKAFFLEMATKYKDHPNVIYEICNEPNGSTDWDNGVRPYAMEVSRVIRSVSPSQIIIVGSPQWSSRPDLAAKSPVTYRNVMYSFHFYSGTHKDDYRQRIRDAKAQGIPVIITEFGTSEASGNGGPYLDETTKWLTFLRDNQMSWMTWSFSDVSESSALLRPGASVTGPWPDSQLSDTGRYIKGKMLEQ